VPCVGLGETSLPYRSISRQNNLPIERETRIRKQENRGAPMDYNQSSVPSVVAISEDSVAQAFAVKHGDDLRFCHGPNRWYEWDGTRWKPATTRLAYHWCRAVAREATRGADDDWQLSSLGRAAFVSGVERFAQADRIFAVTPDIWDRDPWLLGTPRGVLDLRTGELRPASRSDYITKQTMVGPTEPGVESPAWERFLDQITCGDRQLRRFLLQFLVMP
jgi:putative DNA primase/helicase